MAKIKQPTKSEIITQVLSEINGPTDIDEVVTKVLETYKSTSKKPQTLIRQTIKDWEFNGNIIVFIDSNTIVPLKIAMPGVQFRIPVFPNMARTCTLPTYFFIGFMNIYGMEKDYAFFDENDQPIKTKVVRQKNKDIANMEEEAYDLSQWPTMQKAKSNDNIIITIKSWIPRQFQFRFETRKERRKHEEEIQKKNKELANTIFDMLENSNKDYLDINITIPTVHLISSDPKGYPGDHWVDVIQADGRMRTDSFSIKYYEDLNFFDSIIDGKRSAFKKQKITGKSADQIYVFKAQFSFNKKIWRFIEIAGNQTLSDFDDILRIAFKHDTSDHLSGFWKLVTRGKTKRVRKIDLANIDPFGKGEGSNLKIAELGLNIGDKLEYVYDFGDWIDHEITLEAINPKADKVKYPQITEQNKPKYEYCEECKSEGKETIAEYFCVTCSNKKQREILLCEKCIDKNHEDHYYNEITY